MFLHVNSVELLDGYSLRLEFDDGSVRDVDLLAELHGVMFEPLRDRALFRNVAVNPETGTVEWPNGADFAPEFLHGSGTPARQPARTATREP